MQDFGRGFVATTANRISIRIVAMMPMHNMKTAAFLLLLALTPLGPLQAQQTTATKTATFSMYCYWTGEATLGRVPGIVRTQIGHIDGLGEIVRATYDPAHITLRELVEALKRQASFYAVIAFEQDRVDPELAGLPPSEIRRTSKPVKFIPDKYSLKTRHPDLYYLDLTEPQAIALNSWSYFGGEIPRVLTPEQESLRRRLMARLQTQPQPNLQPQRIGAGRERYRQQLLDWLKN